MSLFLICDYYQTLLQCFTKEQEKTYVQIRNVQQKKSYFKLNFARLINIPELVNIIFLATI